MIKPDRSTVTVVIANFNGRTHLQKNLPAVIKACQSACIIVSDDGSTDDSLVLLASYPEIQVVSSPQNRGFSSACSLGAEKAVTPYLLFLNNDISPHPNFLDILLTELTSNNRLFAVNPLEINPDSTKYAKSGRSVGRFIHGILRHYRHPRQITGDTLWCSGGSMLVRRNYFTKLGGFRTIYDPGYWEDIDLSWRAHQHGWQTRFVAEAVVTHHHRSTFQSVYRDDQIKIISYRNMFLFHWLNLRGTQLTGHLVWLPLNLVINSWRTRGLYAKSFIQAIIRYFTHAH